MSEIDRIATAGLRGKLHRAEPMRKRTSWRVGGPADHAYVPADLDDLCAFLQALPAGEPVTFVGLGSNLLIRDGGIRGTVVLTHTALKALELTAAGEIYTEAGVAAPKVARFAATHALQGAEFLAGIPGTVGGALAMNAGCYGAEIWELVARVLTVDRRGVQRERGATEFTVGYRSVTPKEPREEFFAAAWLRLARGDGEQSRQRIKELLQKRIDSQPLEQPNAGSVFRNPPGDHAARLIESCGLKGLRIGGAMVSTKHANFIVNLGDAAAADIERLIDTVQTLVHRETGVMLHREVLIVGEA
ncbi:MAG TPA: UDP-N-acetylmuramate dehydrogenase [Burkholderiales bacterium]|nr:UDP-N-acetylmuramate dehydrogenase [Burkholderiales bacterium]